MPVVKVSIRSAVSSEMATVSEIFRRSSLANEGDRANLLAHPDALAFSSRSVDEGRTRVAVIDDRVVGFATVLVAGRVGQLDDLFVDPEWMQRGVGRALVLDAVDNVRRLDVMRIEVIANDHARGFYEKVGFLLDGVSQTRFGPAHRMHLDLLP